ncbi:MAG: endonuclease III domain-containing protein [Desulfobacteraceae bacterium]|nr:endonuclease III domain-containing protein [Desulfobacteraceae bacterium]
MKRSPNISNWENTEQSTPHTLLGQRLMEMFDLLLAHFGPQNWWPAKTELEVMIGAILTQNTNWTNVEKAISNLKNKDLVSLDSLVSLSVEDLAKVIQPAGYYNIKAKRLKNLINFIFDQYDGDLAGLLQEETDRLREGLLSVNGVGPETADSIILYAAKRPLFVVDAYTHRILNRHAMVGEDVTYYDLQGLFMDHLLEDAPLFNEFHALIVLAGKNYCRKNPRCEDCPLNQWGLQDNINDMR